LELKSSDHGVKHPKVAGSNRQTSDVASLASVQQVLPSGVQPVEAVAYGAMVSPLGWGILTVLSRLTA